MRPLASLTAALALASLPALTTLGTGCCRLFSGSSDAEAEAKAKAETDRLIAQAASGIASVLARDEASASGPSGPSGPPGPSGAPASDLAAVLAAKTRLVEGKRESDMGAGERFVFTMQVAEPLRDLSNPEATASLFGRAHDDAEGPAFTVAAGHHQTLDDAVKAVAPAGGKVALREALGAGWVMAHTYEATKRVQVDWSDGTPRYSLGCSGIASGERVWAKQAEVIAFLAKTCKSIVVKERTPPKD